MIITFGLISLGAVGGALSNRLPLHGTVAMGLALLPFGGFALATIFC
jgi:hypothetical protein